MASTQKRETSPSKTPAKGPTFARRDFIALSTLTMAAASFGSFPAMAGPFETDDFKKLIPPNKHLRPEWVHSLYARGEPEVWSKKRGELRYIGMPVGGITCGTLYLGGDGRLWLWDIFNQNSTGILSRSVPWDGFGQPHDIGATSGGNYVEPHTEQAPLEQGFALKMGDSVKTMDAAGWDEITFCGQYPIGTVRYTDPASPLSVALTAYSPFIPLNADDSGLPLTFCEFTLHNETGEAVEAEMAGWLENAVCLHSARPKGGTRLNHTESIAGSSAVISGFDPALGPQPARRPDIVVDDFDHPGYGQWKTTGTAFGSGPVLRQDVPSYQGDLGGIGPRVVNTHASAPGTTVEQRDSAVGTLTSPPFLIERSFLSFYIGGGSNIEQVGMRLLVEGKTVRQAAGQNNNHMRPETFDLSDLQGRQAVIEIYDQGTGPWGNIGVSDIVQTDAPALQPVPPTAPDYGEMAIALLGGGEANAEADLQQLFTAPSAAKASRTVGSPLLGSVKTSFKVAPHSSHTLTFLIAWHFPNSGLNVADAKEGSYYAKKFADVSAVVRYAAENYERLSRDTKKWSRTWYDSTLPHWFLDRSFVNTSILATSTAHRFGTGRFWGWEGIGCCEGTCTHVWHYAQAPGRIFPELERYVREKVDFGVAFSPDTGMIGYRGEGTGPAVDGQCGVILEVLREHQMSADNSFLTRIWPKVKVGMGFLMHHDADGDGLLEGAQENTLDAAWYGEIAWISSLYAAALRACEEMARDMGDTGAEALYHEKFLQSKEAIDAQLFNGEYFIQKPDPAHPGALGTYGACHIDQVMGQGWAWQVGLGRTLDREKTLSALKALYRYNFALDVGPFRRANKPGRAYALAGDGGLIMATNPYGLPHPFGNDADWQYGYFNECMSGFEHQAAGHMIAEGLLEEGLAVTRAIHDRYSPLRRNPYNEIECSDHYSRAMASYGSFLSLCGYESHGPRGHIGFAPRLTPENFRAAFTAAEGWGAFHQKIQEGKLQAGIAVRHGRLSLKTIALMGEHKKAVVTWEGRPVAASVASQQGRCLVTLTRKITLEEGQELQIELS